MSDKYVVKIESHDGTEKGYYNQDTPRVVVTLDKCSVLNYDDADWVKYQFDCFNYGFNAVVEKYVEPVSQPTTKEVKMSKFKLGDKVIVNENAKNDRDVGSAPAVYVGKIGYVDDFFFKGQDKERVGVTFDGVTGPTFALNSVDLIVEKKKPLPFSRSNNKVLTIVANGKSYTVAEDHPNYKKISEAIVDGDATELDDLVNPVKSVVKFAAPLGVEVKDGVLYKDGQPLRGAIGDKIISLHKDGLPIDPLVKFYENLMANPSKRAVEELYPFLEHKGLPITDDGCFLGYKRVRDNWTDLHTGTVLNTVGKVLEMPRNLVDDNWMNSCSAGFHVGSIEYVRNFSGGTGHVVIVKVNPKDVVSVPHHDSRKLRTCKYEVLQEYDRNLIDPLQDRLHTASGDAYEIEDDEEFWDNWDQDEVDDDEDEYGSTGFYDQLNSRTF